MAFCVWPSQRCPCGVPAVCLWCPCGGILCGTTSCGRLFLLIRGVFTLRRSRARATRPHIQAPTVALVDPGTSARTRRTPAPHRIYHAHTHTHRRTHGHSCNRLLTNARMSIQDGPGTRPHPRHTPPSTNKRTHGTYMVGQQPAHIAAFPQMHVQTIHGGPGPGPHPRLPYTGIAP